jgi:hypothetical protein
MKYFRTITLLALVFMFVGCVTPPTNDELMLADYGQFPTEPEPLIKDYMQSRLKDPSSAQYQFVGGPVKMWVKGDTVKHVFGYGICTRINAKNSFGGYTGAQPYLFMIKNDSIIYFESAAFMVAKWCNL